MKVRTLHPPLVTRPAGIHGRSMIESIPPEIAGKFRADAAASPDNSLVVDADFVAAVLMAGADEETIDQTPPAPP